MRPRYRGPVPAFINGYLIDILLPASMYLLLGLFQHPAVQRSIVRGVAVLAVGATTVTLQHFGVPCFAASLIRWTIWRSLPG